MGWFGGKANHKKEVDAAFKVFGNLYERTTNGSASALRGLAAPQVLSFRLADSRFRYSMFCLSTVQAACARRMKNPDAVLNELLHTIVAGATNDAALQEQLFGGPVEPQHAANLAGSCVEDYLHRWSAYVDIVGGGNKAAATSIVCAMLQSTESTDPATAGDGRRLWPLATWIEGCFDPMALAFSDMAR